MTLDWVSACDAPIDCTPARLDDNVVLIGAMDSSVHAVRLVDGSRLQLLALDSQHGQRVDVFPTGPTLEREIKKAPLVAGDRLIVGSHSGGVFALRFRG